MKLAHKSLVLLTLLSSGVISACQESAKQDSETSPTSSASSDTEPLAAVTVGVTLTAEQTKLAETLVESVHPKKWLFGAPEARLPENLPVLLHLGATGDEPTTAAALAAISLVRKPSEPVSEDLVQVLFRGLNAQEPRIAGRAVTLSRLVIAQAPDPNAISTAVAKLTHVKPFSHGGGLYQLIDALSSFGRRYSSTPVIDVFKLGLDATEPHVVARALNALSAIPIPKDRATELRQRVLALVTHEEPAVRGGALYYLGRNGKSVSAVENAATAALKDESGYVRAEACRALGLLRHKPAIPAVLPLLDDTAKGYVDINGPGTVTDDVARKRYQPTPLGSVQHACIEGFRELTGRGFELTAIPPNDRPGGLAKNAETAKAWYAKHKDELTQVVPAASTTPTP